MEHFLAWDTLANYPRLAIDSQRFLLLKRSRDILAEALELEEEYEMMISSYIDLEKEFMNVSISHMVRSHNVHNVYLHFCDTRLALNRRLMNLLTSVRLYLDDLTAHCSACLPEQSEIEQQVESLRSTEYQKNFDYRFMEALRNYIQHYGIAVHQVMFQQRATASDLDINGLFEFSSSFWAEKKLIASDGHFKKPILDEMPDRVELISASRGYIEALSSIHNNVRQMTSKSVNEARPLIQTAIDDYRAVYKKDLVGLNAYVFDGKTKIDEIPIFLIGDDIRIQLEKRNRQLVNLKRKYPTGQVRR